MKGLEIQDLEPLLAGLRNSTKTLARDDLQGLVMLADGLESLAVALEEKFPAVASTTRLGARTAQRVVLGELDDTDGALATLRQTVAWLEEALAGCAAGRQVDAPLPGSLHYYAGRQDAVKAPVQEPISAAPAAPTTTWPSRSRKTRRASGPLPPCPCRTPKWPPPNSNAA